MERASWQRTACSASVAFCTYKKLAVFFALAAALSGLLALVSCSCSPVLANQSKSRRHASKRPAAKARKERLHHTQTAWQLRTERASRQRPVVPKVAFCTYKKLAVFLLLPPLSPAAAKAQKERLRHTQTAGQ